MNIKKTIILVSGIDVEIVRKNIKNLHLAVYPPDGHVRVAVPEHITDDNVRLAIVSKLSWIKKQQRVFKEQPRQSERRFISSECHYFGGKRYRLQLIERPGKGEIKALKSGRLKMFVTKDVGTEQKKNLLNSWYRDQLKTEIPKLLAKWQPIIGKEVSHWGVRKMKTKWGSCNTERRRITLNLELIKKPHQCLEYILVHELIHLHERNHDTHFKSLMDKYLPKWRGCRDLLKKMPLGHGDWRY
ncbi:MAG: M48 family metallopeptidase [Desulfobacteraceae bacterium]|nr:M48 family metallopeptidase [Desulfobacteraceae bacterium]